MSNPPDRPWSEDEKNILLTEILKKDGIASSQLFKLIRDNSILPKWTEIPLPPGRSLSSCQMAFNQMHHSHIPDQRQFQHFPLESPSSSAHLPPYQAPQQSRKRPIQPLEPPNRSAPNTPRAIQPRPPTSGGGTFNGSSSADSGPQPAQLSPGLDTTMSEPPRKKRGRPSKLEIQRRKAVAQAKGEEYPPKKKPGPKPKNRQLESSPRRTAMGSGGDSHRSQLSTATSRLQTAMGMDEPPGSATLRGEPSSATSDRRRREQMERPTAEQQQHQSVESQNLRSDSTLGSSPRTRLGGSMYPPADTGMGGTRVIGRDEPGTGGGGGGGGGSLSTPRTILASQMSAQPTPPSYAPSFRGINEITAAPGASHTSAAQSIGSGSPHPMGHSPTVTMAGENIPGGVQKYQIAPGPGGGGGGGAGGGGSGPGGKKT